MDGPAELDKLERPMVINTFPIKCRTENPLTLVNGVSASQNSQKLGGCPFIKRMNYVGANPLLYFRVD